MAVRERRHGVIPRRGKAFALLNAVRISDRHAKRARSAACATLIRPEARLKYSFERRADALVRAIEAVPVFVTPTPQAPPTAG